MLQFESLGFQLPLHVQLDLENFSSARFRFVHTMDEIFEFEFVVVGETEGEAGRHGVQ